MNSQKILFQIKNLEKHYAVNGGGFKKNITYIKAVNGITINIFANETLGVVGESGSGKSTFGRTILGLETCTSGNLYYDGQELSASKSLAHNKRLKKEMQMIFQDPYSSLDPKQKIGKAISEPLVIHTKLSKKERYEKVITLLKEVGLKAENYERFPHQFSGGQRQRIGIARALACEPKFIVCDEPVSALDVSVQTQVIKLLQTLQETHKLTYLFISHDLGIVRHVCDRTMVMYLGRAMELAPVKKLYANPYHPYTEALLSAVPRPTLARKQERIKIKGEIPSVTKLPTGCVFHTRCPLATEKCRQEQPVWREVEPEHFVACHLR